MAATNTQNQPYTSNNPRTRNDNQALWAIVALIVVALVAYAVYASYYHPSRRTTEYGT